MDRSMGLKASNQQLAVIHVLKGKARMDDDTYRDLLHQQFGVRSSKDLDRDQAGRLIERLRELAGEGAPLARCAVAGLNSPLGGKLRALWIAGYNLGLVRDRTDRAMLSFLERQTGVSHVRFLTEPRQGTQAVEGLKAWLARDGGVKWVAEKEDGDGLASRRSVVIAQWERLVDLGGAINDGFFEFAFRVTRAPHGTALTAQEYDQVQAALGQKLRAAIEAKAARAAEHAA